MSRLKITLTSSVGVVPVVVRWGSKDREFENTDELWNGINRALAGTDVEINFDVRRALGLPAKGLDFTHFSKGTTLPAEKRKTSR